MKAHVCALFGALRNLCDFAFEWYMDKRRRFDAHFQLLGFFFYLEKSLIRYILVIASVFNIQCHVIR